jgi:type I restriction enzyme S subunit
MLDLDYLYYRLKTLSQILESYSQGTATKFLTMKILSPLEIQLPPLLEQKAIAHILGSLDDRIELNRRMNETLEAMAQAFFKSWFVDFDPVIDNAQALGKEIPEDLLERAAARATLGDKRKPLPEEIRALFPNEFTDSDDLGWIPMGWKAKTVNDEIDTVGGGTPSTKDPSFWEGGVHAFCTPKDMSNMTSKILTHTDRLLTNKGVAKISSGQLPERTVLMSSRAPIGYLAINNVPVSVNQGIIAMKTSSRYGEMFLVCWAQANMERIKERANGSTFLEISKKNFRLIPFLVPNADLLKFFNKITEPVLSRIIACTKNSQELSTLRDTLLPKLLSGELRIPDAEKMVEELA